MGRPFKCPYCGSSDTTGKGVRKTKTMGVRRIRRCKACRRKFTPKSQQLVDTASASQSAVVAPTPETGRPDVPSPAAPEGGAP
jgi:transcriptional regulator NrdR family protein